jgi:serine/threonine protein phosphatase PrpC
MSTSFPLDSMRVRFAGDTHVGLTRSHNEDSIHLPVDERLAIVADGMGGHASGEVASKMAVDTVVEYFKETAEEQILTWPFKVDRQGGADVMRLVTAIKLANVKIHEQAQRDPACKGMGTTIVSALFLDDRIIIAHVGDSRLYRLREGTIALVTEDHSLINDYIKMKRMTAEEAAAWPHKNVIVRALGMKESVQVDIHTDSAKLGDCFLLCSDGLSGMISDEEIREIVDGEKDLDRAAERLISAANAAGGKDNITVVLARIEPA